MSEKWKAVIDLAVDLAVAYQETRKPRKPVLAADAVLLVITMVMVLTAVGFGLAAAFCAMLPALGAAGAALLTATIALGVAVAAFAISRALMHSNHQ
jgi:hypothetical protein